MDTRETGREGEWHSVEVNDPDALSATRQVFVSWRVFVSDGTFFERWLITHCPEHHQSMSQQTRP